jgi:IclR family acetate operon transcriptional repressor
MKNQPTYAIASVDNALHLAQLLQQEGSLSVSESAELLGVARSTAHRLLTMLVYRDFAEQGPDRRYRPGRVLVPAATTSALTLRRAALPALQELVDRVNETASLEVLNGTDARFVESIECRHALRVGNRSGKVFPAHQVAGGKAMLAALSAQELSRLYQESDIDLVRLRKQLALVRARGYAVNDQESEDGVTAVGVVVLGADGEPAAAVALGVPSVRFRRTAVAGWLPPLQTAAANISAALRESSVR